MAAFARRDAASARVDQQQQQLKLPLSNGQSQQGVMLLDRLGLRCPRLGHRTAGEARAATQLGARAAAGAACCSTWSSAAGGARVAWLDHRRSSCGAAVELARGRRMLWAQGRLALAVDIHLGRSGRILQSSCRKSTTGQGSSPAVLAGETDARGAAGRRIEVRAEDPSGASPGRDGGVQPVGWCRLCLGERDMPVVS
ncbi:unnamed protein product [Urochloa humidicola]